MSEGNKGNTGRLTGLQKFRNLISGKDQGELRSPALRQVMKTAAFGFLAFGLPSEERQVQETNGIKFHPSTTQGGLQVYIPFEEAVSNPATQAANGTHKIATCSLRQEIAQGEVQIPYEILRNSHIAAESKVGRDEISDAQLKISNWKEILEDRRRQGAENNSITLPRPSWADSGNVVFASQVESHVPDEQWWMTNEDARRVYQPLFNAWKEIAGDMKVPDLLVQVPRLEGQDGWGVVTKLEDFVPDQRTAYDAYVKAISQMAGVARMAREMGKEIFGIPNEAEFRNLLGLEIPNICTLRCWNGGESTKIFTAEDGTISLLQSYIKTRNGAFAESTHAVSVASLVYLKDLLKELFKGKNIRAFSEAVSNVTDLNTRVRDPIDTRLHGEYGPRGLAFVLNDELFSNGIGNPFYQETIEVPGTTITDLIFKLVPGSKEIAEEMSGENNLSDDKKRLLAKLILFFNVINPIVTTPDAEQLIQPVNNNYLLSLVARNTELQNLYNELVNMRIISSVTAGEIDRLQRYKNEGNAAPFLTVTSTYDGQGIDGQLFLVMNLVGGGLTIDGNKNGTLEAKVIPYSNSDVSIFIERQGLPSLRYSGSDPIFHAAPRQTDTPSILLQLPKTVVHEGVSYPVKRVFAEIHTNQGGHEDNFGVYCSVRD